MFRQSIRRCATQARTAASASLVAQCRSTLPIARRQIVPSLSSSIAPLNRFTSIYRAYSSEATAEATEVANDASTEELTRFADLQKLGIHPNLLDAITQGMNYETMTPVQAKTIVPALKGTDIVAQAKTGTGKTLAFLLPLLQRMLAEDPSLASRSARRTASSDDIRGIILSPTRELAEQIASEARRLVKNTGLVVQCAVGGTDKRKMLQMTRRNGCHLLVATPGRLNDLLEDERSGIDAPNLAALVLDEADRMLDTGFEKELQSIIRFLPQVDEKVRQTMLVSATIPDNVIRLARTMVRPQDFEFVQTIPENESLTHDKVPQHIVPISSWTNVFPTLFELVDREVAKAKEDPEGRPFKAIVYLNTTSLVELAGELSYQRSLNNRDALPSYVMQSKLTQGQRQRAADDFRRARSGILLSSDVTARGMDFPNVTHVIQIDSPRDRESYIHRLGRTGRQNKEGEGWLLIPHISVRSAKKLLRGLPIQQSALDSAEVDVEAGQASPHHHEVKDLIRAMPRQLMGSVYTSMFGVAEDKIELADDINSWSLNGWGWDRPPYVSKMWVQRMGLGRARGMNIQDRPSRESVDRESDNPFDAMKSQVRRDDGFRSSEGRGDRGRQYGNRDHGRSNNRFNDRGNDRRSDRGYDRGGDRGYDRGSSW